MSEAYSTLAQFYDLCMEVDYQEWVRYLLALMLRHRHLPKNILDAGCGTGNITVPLAKRGYDLTGVDLSAEMIGVAKAKATAEGLQIPFFVQKLQELQLPPNKFDTVISACDVMNYITTQADLERSFLSVQRLLPKGGLWLFDLNSAQKLQETYGDQSYADLRSDFGYFWDNSYDWEQGICTMELTFFVRTKEGLYQRVTEQHRQKLWMPEEIKELSAKLGFSLLACYDFLSTDPCGPRTDRWQFVLQKK